MKSVKVAFWSLLFLLPMALEACPGCFWPAPHAAFSGCFWPTVDGIRIDPAYRQWVYILLAGVFLSPVVFYLCGFRVVRTKSTSRTYIWLDTGILTLFWLLCSFIPVETYGKILAGIVFIIPNYFSLMVLLVSAMLLSADSFPVLIACLVAAFAAAVGVFYYISRSFNAFRIIWKYSSAAKQVKSIVFILFGTLCLLFANGCIVSRTGEQLCNIGVVEYYADFSTIKDQVVHEKNGEFYIEVEAAGYKPDPAWIGLMVPGLSHLIEYKIPVEAGRQSAWLKVSPEVKAYLCDDLNGKDGNSDSSPVYGEVVTDTGNLTPDAAIHRIIRTMPPPEKITFCCGDIISNSQLLYREKSAGSYWLLPVAVIGYAWDIPATVVMSAYFDFILLPNLLIAEGGKKLLGRNSN